jgi:hypothetical protein
MGDKLARIWLAILIFGIFISIGMAYYRYMIISDFKIMPDADTITAETQ